MRIDRLLLESFGAFHGVAVDLEPGLNLFFGPNERGKSTLIDGLLLGLSGAPLNDPIRERYTPLGRSDYRIVIHLTASDGESYRIERDLARDGRDSFGTRRNGEWIVRRKADAALKKLGLPSLDLARSIMVISGNEVVLAGKNEETVSKAISARATTEEGNDSGQQVKKRLDERRRLLENKERKELQEALNQDETIARDLAEAEEEGRRLSEIRQRAEAALASGQELAAHYQPAVKALEELEKARSGHREISGKHQAVYKDLREILRCEEEIAVLEDELQPLAPLVRFLSPEPVARARMLAGMRQAREQTAAQNAEAANQLRQGLSLLREKLALLQRAGFTLERLRELERIEAGVELARRNLDERQAALEQAGNPRANLAGPIMALLLALTGGAVGAFGWWPGWVLGGAGLILGLVLFAVRQSRTHARAALASERLRAAKELEVARAALVAFTGGRDRPSWQKEYETACGFEEEIRLAEARLKALTEAAATDENEEGELSALLAEAGSISFAEYEKKAESWAAGQRRLENIRRLRDSLQRGRLLPEWREEELALARAESTAQGVLADAEKAAAGLDPVEVARYRAELAALDLPALERAARDARLQEEQHRRIALRRDPWEIRTALDLDRARLEENGRRAGAVRLAMEILDQAITEVQHNLVPRIESRAGEYFRALTGGRYEGLMLTSGADLILAEPRRGGEKLPARILSTGTADQMYLALRLALREALQGPEPSPLILDDPFLTFDRERLGYAVDLLSSLAGEDQIILVTKDEVLRDLAAAKVKAKELPAAN